MEINEELRLILGCWLTDYKGLNIVLVNDKEGKGVEFENVDYEWDGMTIHIFDEISEVHIKVEDIEELGEQLVIGDWLLEVW